MKKYRLFFPVEDFNISNFGVKPRSLFMAWCLSSGAACQPHPCMSGESGLPKSYKLEGPSFPALSALSAPQAKESVSSISPRTSQKSCWEGRQESCQAQLSWKPAWIPLEIDQKWEFFCGTFWFQWTAYPDEKMFHQKFSSQIVLCWR